MRKFFNQNVTELELDEEDHVKVERMEWLDVQIPLVYWRQCYSYILCSTIAFFEKVHKEFSEAADDEVREYNSMILTGVQGTGKSILGAVIGLFISKVFHWEVHYWWKGEDFCFGTPGEEHKVIHIFDISQGKPENYPTGFVLIVSSTNKERWKDLAQQQSLSFLFGNYCFIDPAPEKEVEAMAAGRGKNSRDKAAKIREARKAFKYVGGVPRLCLRITADVAKEKVDGALAEFSIMNVINKLSALDDAISEANPGMKIYPGLVGHVFPTNSFRNDYEIQAPSPYIGRGLAQKTEEKSDKKLQQIMSDLLDIPKACGFAVWIWEPLLSKKMSGQDANISIVGSALPVNAGDPSIEVLLQVHASAVDFVEFGSMTEFKEKAGTKAGECKNNFCLFAKATSDYFAAIDAVILFREENRFVVAALQLTVAEKYHSVLQSMILEFMDACSSIYNSKPEPQLWFIQPEQSLSYFGFVNVQAMEFDEVTFPLATSPAATTTRTADSGTRNSKRKRYRTEKYGKWAPVSQPQGRLKSNNKSYWDKAVRSLPQFVGIAHIGQNKTKCEAENPIRSKFIRALKALQDSTHVQTGVAKDPQLRSWKATTDIMGELGKHVHRSLMDAIQRDIALDKQRLEDAGVELDGVTLDRKAADLRDVMDESYSMCWRIRGEA